MEIYKPLSRNSGRWFQTRSWTHRGLILRVLENPLRILYVDLMKNNKLETYGLKGFKSEFLDEQKPTKKDMLVIKNSAKKIIEDIFEMSGTY